MKFKWNQRHTTAGKDQAISKLHKNAIEAKSRILFNLVQASRLQKKKNNQKHTMEEEETNREHSWAANKPWKHVKPI